MRPGLAKGLADRIGKRKKGPRRNEGPKREARQKGVDRIYTSRQVGKSPGGRQGEGGKGAVVVGQKNWGKELDGKKIV